jgi:hypothetical protein
MNSKVAEMIIIATSITSRTVDLSWKHTPHPKQESKADVYYRLSKGEISSLNFNIVYEGKDTFCIVTDLKVYYFSNY